jgi:D-amino-acid dehydrogenase
MQTQKVDVLVLGAGIVGASTAYALQKAGRKVLLVDKGQPGFGCSYGNAGWITPCFAMPLPQPGMFLKSIGWLLNPESPLHIKPEISWTLFKWLMSFMQNMNKAKMNQSIDVLTEISKDSFDFYKNLSLKKQDFGFEQKGLLMVSATKAGLQAAEEEMDLMAKRGIRGQRLFPNEILEMEPTLKENLTGGVFFPDEAHSEPLDTVLSIVKEFESLGGKTQAGTEVYGFEFENKKIKKVKTTRGDFEADLIVMAMGSWSKVLAKQLQAKIPILGGKGYSLILKDYAQKPRYPLMIVEKKIAITPRRNSLKLAGTLELVDHQDLSITQRRVNAILKGSQEFLKLPNDIEIQEVWRGLRPCTPDGVPMIGFSQKWSNLFYCTGHQMLGLQSAPGSARLAKEIILGERPFVDPRPFRPERF